MKALFLADAMLPRAEDHNLSALNRLQYSSLPELRVALSAIPHGVLLGPVLLATIVRERGHDAEVLECAFRPQQKGALRQALRARPDVVCLSTTFMPDLEAVRSCVEIVRRYAPGAKVILGGPSLTENLEMRRLGDYCVIGEGERALPLLLDSLAAGDMAPEIPGLCYESPLGYREFPGALLESMDDTPFPDWSLVKRSPHDFYLLATQRGCRWRCAFCTYPANEGWKLRYRSVPSVLAELRRNYELFGIYRYMFADSTFTHPHDRCLELLRGIAALPFRVEWAAYARVDNLTAELADAMSASGCTGLFFGIESGDDTILKRMNKGFTVAQAEKGIRLLDRRGISRTASWVVGFPGETAATAAHTLDLIRRLGCEQNMLNAFYLCEGSPAAMRPKVFGLSGGHSGWEHSSMDFATAQRTCAQMVEALMQEGVQVGHVFDLLWLSSVGWSVSRTLQLFRDAQAVVGELGGSLAVASARQRLRIECSELLLASRRHPIFSTPVFTHAPLAAVAP